MRFGKRSNNTALRKVPSLFGVLCAVVEEKTYEEGEYIMETIMQQNGYILSVDIDRTREYYKNISLCNCGGCRNFYAQAREKLPKTGNFLAEFGVAVDRPDEIAWIDDDNGITYLFVSYTVCGKIIRSGNDEMNIADTVPVSIVINDPVTSGGYVPNQQQGDYFVLDVMINGSLPWVLDEPFQESYRKERLLDKMKKIFKK